jgi:alpha-L-fucosidase 2
LDLLPALPKSWPDGSVKGLLARGGFEVDVEWADSALARATVRSRNGGSCRLRSGSVTRDVVLGPDEVLVWNGK